MKKLFSLLVTGLLILSVMPMVIAEGDDDATGIGITIVEPPTINVCPKIYQDATQRSWEPNDQTFHTATEYGSTATNCYGNPQWDVEDRGNYIFTGETLTYYVLVEDTNGVDDIDNVYIANFGACLEITPPADSEIDTCTNSGYLTWDAYALDKFRATYDSATMNLYKCKLIPSSSATGSNIIKIQAEDEHTDVCVGVDPDSSEIKETLTINPILSVTLSGSINFGSVEAGSIATSNPITINNVGINGVVMDMYIASDDYFIDPANSLAICGDGNGIKYDQFSYYATKGATSSGFNDNAFYGLGEDSGICSAKADEFTPMPSHSGEIEDMCRIINHLEKGSFLTQGDFMSLTLRLDVPSNCGPYSYTDGEFHVVGRVV